ncbi:MAG: flagellar biosynthesis protein FlhB [Ignavibacteriaceae bacterium]|nr:flagellar biosynthesis protein FlhB [Ignavibacteriaceae bacterium]
MAEHDGLEKSEQPTSKKLEDARNRGQVAKSLEVNSLAVFVTGLILLYLFQNFIGSRVGNFSVSIFSSLDILKNRISLVPNFAFDWYIHFVITITPILLGILIVSLFTNFSQVGLNFSSEALVPKFSKLNILNGVKNLFSIRASVEVLKSLFKLLIIGSFTYWVLKSMIDDATLLETLTIGDIVTFMLDSAFSLLWKVALIFVALAAVDFVFQKYKFKKDMMMSKQEVKEELKQTEGDPQIKGRIKRLMYQAAKNRMMNNLPKADVVITNPTHYAVALKYDMQKDQAPEVIAKGVDELAQKIKEIAAKHNIPIKEDRELARALYKMCDIGDKIPATLFKSVAQVLAYVYNLKNEKKKKSIV